MNDARELILSGRAPANLSARCVNLSDAKGTFELPPQLQCFELKLAGSSVQTLPAGIKVAHRIDLTGCENLTRLPDGLQTGTLILKDCTALTALPQNLAVHFLVLDGCGALEDWPDTAKVNFGYVSARNCTSLLSIPATLGPITSLDLVGCTAIKSLPEGLRASSWIDFQGTQIRALPESLRGVDLRWRGVTIPERVLFSPETVTSAEILSEATAAVRRVMLECIGVERFMTQARALVRDQDRDAGGERRLLAVELPGDEPLVCLLVQDPATSRRHILRVPPETKTCRDAVAWIGGFQNSKSYVPEKKV